MIKSWADEYDSDMDEYFNDNKTQIMTKKVDTEYLKYIIDLKSNKDDTIHNLKLIEAINTRLQNLSMI
jgi:hypothetical protein